jgi:hypothetical protein
MAFSIRRKTTRLYPHREASDGTERIIETALRVENLWVSHPPVASGTPVTRSPLGARFPPPSPLEERRPRWGLGLKIRGSTPILTFRLPGGRHPSCFPPRLPLRGQTLPEEGAARNHSNWLVQKIYGRCLLAPSPAGRGPG